MTEKYNFYNSNETKHSEVYKTKVYRSGVSDLLGEFMSEFAYEQSGSGQNTFIEICKFDID